MVNNLKNSVKIKKINLQINKLDFLISLYIFCIAVAELMGSKTFPLLDYGKIQLNASIAIFVIPLLFTINDVITEVYGADRTRSVIRSGLIIIFFILLFSIFSTRLPPSKRFEKTESAYDTIFGVSARIAASSLILPYWLLKCFMSVIDTPFVYLGVKWLRGEQK